MSLSDKGDDEAMERWSCEARAFVAGVLLAVPAVGLTGCGGGSGAKIERVVPVSGTLTFKGQPLEHHQVTLQPEDGRRAAVGVSDAAGKFTLGTNDVADGAPPGRSRVAVVFAPPTVDTSLTASAMDKPVPLPKPKVKIPTKYNSAQTSNLTREIPEEGQPDLKIDLE